MAKKLAITISGAVSLGCYEAGVLFEVITALDYHNRSADGEAKIEIDVLTGASAGGMTAAIAAQKLLFEAEALNDPYDNSLYRAWVKDIDLEGLLKLQAFEDPTHSLFSSNLVEDISKKHLTDRYTSGIPVARNKHAAASDTIHLGLALANLNGIDYQRDLRKRPAVPSI